MPTAALIATIALGLIILSLIVWACCKVAGDADEADEMWTRFSRADDARDEKRRQVADHDDPHLARSARIPHRFDVHPAHREVD